MTFSNIDSLNLGLILQIAFSQGVRTQISKAFPDWEMVNRMRISNTLARELRFMFQSSFGPAAVQFANPGTTNRAFPASQQSSISENTAKLKEIDVTVEIEHSLWERASKSPEKYAEPLALEMDGKQTAAKRLIASLLYSDGSGVMAQVAADPGGGANVVHTAYSAGPPVVNASVAVLISETDAARGFIGGLQFNDLLVAYSLAGAARVPQKTSGGAGALPNFYAWRVKSRNRRTGVAVLEPVDSAGNVLQLMTSSNIVATDVFYRVGQETISDIPDLTAAVSDWGAFTTVFPGLESLAANDGRVVHGIMMSGSSAGTRVDNGGALIDTNAIHGLLDDVKVNVGEGSYAYKMLCMAPETQRAFIESRETDRRFISATDGTRGTPSFKYIHRNDTLELYVSEFIKKTRIWALPEGKGKDGKVLEFWGTDFATVKGQGTGDFHLKPSASGGHVNMMVSYMRAYNTLICKHPAAIGCLTNFAIV